MIISETMAIGALFPGPGIMKERREYMKRTDEWRVIHDREK
jgi:hypothetical protein